MQLVSAFHIHSVMFTCTIIKNNPTMDSTVILKKTNKKGIKLMQKTYLILLTILLVGIFVSGCATMPPFSSQPAFEPQEINMTSYQSKVENFVVILDASASMRTWYEGSTRFETAKAIVSRMNQTLPDLNLKGGLRTFGHSQSVSTEKTALMYGMASYTKAGLQTGLDKALKADGNSPLGVAIDAVNQDLGDTSGKTAVIIISDGASMSNAPVEAATRLKKAYGDRVCIYTIGVGSTPAGSKLLNELSQTGACGFDTSAENIATSTGMGGFVTKVFLAKQMDDDHDGIYNDKDRCRGLPRMLLWT